MFKHRKSKAIISGKRFVSKLLLFFLLFLLSPNILDEASQVAKW